MDMPKSDFYSMSLENRLQHNKKILLELCPEYYLMINDFQSQFTYYEKDGIIDLELDGQLLFDGKYLSEKCANPKAQIHDANRVKLSELSSDTVDEEAGAFADNIKQYLIKQGYEIEKLPLEDTYYYMVANGVGLGLPLAEVFEESQCTDIILIEDNKEFLFNALYSFDWEILAELLNKRNGKLHFYYLEDSIAATYKLIHFFRTNLIVNVDGAFIWTHIETPFSREIVNSFSKIIENSVKGLGFFYDETIMLHNADNNLKSGTKRIYKRPHSGQFSLPVFIIGSGPSLDKDIDYIYHKQNDAVIISCGSAILPLLKHNIRPDFHIELENIEVERMLDLVDQNYNMSNICLIAAVTVESEAIKYFDDIILYHREALSPYPLYSGDLLNCLANSGPTVTNAGLSFAQEIGFRNFAFFGVDMGSKDKDTHHSQDSYHYSENAVFNVEDFSYRVKANLGGTCHTNSGLAWARDVLEIQARNFSKGRTYYNCSDGAFIDYTIPMLADYLPFESQDSKHAIVQKIIHSFEEYDSELIEEIWNTDRVVPEIQYFLNHIKSVVKDESFSFNSNEFYWTLSAEALSTQKEIFSHIPENRFKTYQKIYKGTIIMALLATRYFLNRVQSQNRIDVARHMKKEFLNMLEDLEKKTLQTLRSPSTD